MRGRTSLDHRWQAIREDGTELPGKDHLAMVTARTEKPQRDFVFGIHTHEGVARWISVNTEPILASSGDVTMVVSSFADITETKRAARKLNDITGRYAAAIAGTSDGLWDWNCDSEDCWYSNRFWTLLGFLENEPFREANMSSLDSRLRPDDGPTTWDAVRRHQEDGIEFDHEYRLLHQNGEYRWFRGRGVTQFDDSGRAIRMAGSIQDIHDLKLTQHSLVSANVRGEAASAAKSEFLANMSHEIRTPMTAILGFADLLLREIDSEIGKPSCVDYVSTIRRNGEHLLEIINDILDMSKIEACKMTVEKVPAHPEGLVRDAVSLLSVKAQSKGLPLELILDSSVPATIYTDPVRVRQILVNLIGNAIKFTDQGRIKLRVTCDVSEQMLDLAIEDSGIGMSSEQVSRISGAFEQADTTTTRQYGGSGLRLYICNRLADMLGGTITIQSRLGVGSTFTASIATGPISQAATSTCTLASKPYDVSTSMRANASKDSAPLEGIRILLAEDGLDNQRLISHVLRKAGADVQIAENGKLAIEMLTIDGTLESPSRSI
jgi:signal transduction histidine kinase